MRAGTLVMVSLLPRRGVTGALARLARTHARINARALTGFAEDEAVAGRGVDRFKKSEQLVGDVRELVHARLVLGPRGCKRERTLHVVVAGVRRGLLQAFDGGGDRAIRGLVAVAEFVLRRAVDVNAGRGEC